MTKIGMVNFINTAPIYEVWKETVHNPDWQIVEAPPSQLNQMLAAGEIDMGFVSSYEYAIRPDDYMILADLSISATGPVGSVFLFSMVEPERLDGCQLLLSGQSDTSVHLLKIVLEEFYGVTPNYFRGEVFSPGDEQPTGLLAIGDEALRLKEEYTYPIRIDLGEIWHAKTSLPFVFSVCCVRKDYLQKQESEVRQIHKTLLSCRASGLSRMNEICHKVAARIPMDCATCSAYLQGIEHDLQYSKQKALQRFFSSLIDRKEASRNSLPLKIFS